MNALPKKQRARLLYFDSELALDFHHDSTIQQHKKA
jgi:hypothetical protein